MKGVIISKDEGIYLVSGDDGKRYQFATWDWLGKKTPQIGDSVDFIYEDGVVSSVFPILKQSSGPSRVMLALICWFAGIFGVHRFMVGKIKTGIVMLLLSLTIFGLIITGVWAIIDFILIVAGKFSDKNGNGITDW
ncbi:TM2 domain-containing protein [Bartonella sp. CB189]|uniref:TM2 domain-containing protein n=1 Tax=Bartonella sp. CB189 TaxID=3112254 RepID=UPI002F963541